MRDITDAVLAKATADEVNIYEMSDEQLTAWLGGTVAPTACLAAARRIRKESDDDAPITVCRDWDEEESALRRERLAEVEAEIEAEVDEARAAWEREEYERDMRVRY